MGTIYIIHLDSPLQHAKHYVGFTKHFAARIAYHKSGQGAHMLQVCNQRGITYNVVATYKGSRALERKLKNTHNTARYCPICNPTPRTYTPKGV